jgi:hypothetical protein
MLEPGATEFRDLADSELRDPEVLVLVPPGGVASAGSEPDVPAAGEFGWGGGGGCRDVDPDTVLALCLCRAEKSKQCTRPAYHQENVY